MSRTPCASRATLSSLAVFAFVWSGCVVEAPDRGAAAAAAVPRIEWQRTLADALAVAAAEQRPLLLALNMDGESASDRIWREQYRDPAFLAAANRCICVAASLFRHNQRDHDAHGHRLGCPRLPGLTCGEHVALEPQLFAQFLADGERVAPRHVLVRADGSKAFDLSLCFDLQDIDRALQAAVADLPPRPVVDFAALTWDELAARRDHAGRCALEARLAAADEAGLLAGLTAIGRAGDAGALDALLGVGAASAAGAPGAPPPSDAVVDALVAAAQARGLGPALGAVWRERLEASPSWRVIDLRATTDPDAWVCALLARLDGKTPATRSFLLAHAVLFPHGAWADGWLPWLLKPAEVAAVRAAAGQLTAGLDRFPLQAAAAEPTPAAPPLPEASSLEQQLETLDRVPAAARDVAWNARYAKASLDLARCYLETGRKEVPILLEDAELHWRRALAAEPGHADWWIDRARTAFLLGQFAAEAEFGERAHAAAGADAALAIEALRWVGDGHARLLGERAGGEPLAELHGITAGLRALQTVARSPKARARDQLTVASFQGALGLRSREVAELLMGLERFPADRELWVALLGATRDGFDGGFATAAERIVTAAPTAAEALWWAGYAHTVAAEDARRCDDAPAAEAAYAKAAERYTAAMAANPEYGADCQLRLAATWLGRGHALVFADRLRAADCLVAAVQAAPALFDHRDGLGYDVLDLIDKLLEWRADGPGGIDSAALLTRLLVAAPAPTAHHYGLAIADAELREALRADGRNPARVERDTVDASGKPIRMAMGLPTAAGDVYLQRALAAARRVPRQGVPDYERTLAQVATIAAERQLERGRLDGVAEWLAEAAAELGQAPPAPAADQTALAAFAAALRATLGEARPRPRDGR